MALDSIFETSTVKLFACVKSSNEIISVFNISSNQYSVSEDSFSAIFNLWIKSALLSAF